MTIVYVPAGILVNTNTPEVSVETANELSLMATVAPGRGLFVVCAITFPLIKPVSCAEVLMVINNIEKMKSRLIYIFLFYMRQGEGVSCDRDKICTQKALVTEKKKTKGFALFAIAALQSLGKYRSGIEL